MNVAFDPSEFRYPEATQNGFFLIIDCGFIWNNGRNISKLYLECYAEFELGLYLFFTKMYLVSYVCLFFSFPLVKGHKEWLAEVQFLSIVDHPNLVKLLGYCSVDGRREIQRLLVYEFMPNRSLEDHLFSRSFPPLPWKTRLQIMLGAAQGLHYLHHGLEVQVSSLLRNLWQLFTMCMFGYPLKPKLINQI